MDEVYHSVCTCQAENVANHTEAGLEQDIGNRRRRGVRMLMAKSVRKASNPIAKKRKSRQGRWRASNQELQGNHSKLIENFFLPAVLGKEKENRS